MAMPHPHDESAPIWRPSTQEGAPSLDAAILEAAKASDAEVARLVAHLTGAGRFYEAARVLEVVAQGHLGLALEGHELTGHHSPNFGNFHRRIQALMRAGALYLEGGRRRTAQAAFLRAQLFVEEALRQAAGPPAHDARALVCLGLGFELAGHCCVAVGEREGLDYYAAALRYWGQAARMKPEALLAWNDHPVTATVIRCLEPALALRAPTATPQHWPSELFASDYVTRIDHARRLLA